MLDIYTTRHEIFGFHPQYFNKVLECDSRTSDCLLITVEHLRSSNSVAVPHFMRCFVKSPTKLRFRLRLLRQKVSQIGCKMNLNRLSVGRSQIDSDQ